MSGHEKYEYYRMGYKAMYPVEIQPTFQRNIASISRVKE